MPEERYLLFLECAGWYWVLLLGSEAGSFCKGVSRKLHMQMVLTYLLELLPVAARCRRLLFNVSTLPNTHLAL